MQNGAFDGTTINPEADSGVVKVIAYQAVNPGIDGNFVVAEIAFEALGVGERMLDHLISNGAVTICQT